MERSCRRVLAAKAQPASASQSDEAGMNGAESTVVPNMRAGGLQVSERTLKKKRKSLHSHLLSGVRIFQ